MKRKEIKPERFFEGVPERTFETVDVPPKPELNKPNMFKKITKWVKDRFKEPSTYKGVSVITGAIGVSVSPELWEAIAVTVGGIIGIIQVAENESKKNKE